MLVLNSYLPYEDISYFNMLIQCTWNLTSEENIFILLHTVPTEWLIHIMKSKENVFNNPDTEWLKGGSARLSTKCLDRII